MASLYTGAAIPQPAEIDAALQDLMDQKPTQANLQTVWQQMVFRTKLKSKVDGLAKIRRVLVDRRMAFMRSKL